MHVKNGTDLTEDIKKRWQEYTEDLYKKIFMTQNHDRVITNLELVILEWEVKWVPGSVIKNKANEVIEFQLSYFKS